MTTGTPADELRDRLHDAAIDVFAERGYEGARVAEIARRAGLTTGAIYSRWSGKAELLVDALDVKMAESLESILADPAAASPDVVLAMLGSQLLDPERHAVSALLVEAAVAGRREPELGAMLERRLSDERCRVAKIVEAGKADGLLDPDLDTDAVMALIQAIGLGFVLFRTVGIPLPDPDHWQAVIDRLITAASPGGSTR